MKKLEKIVPFLFEDSLVISLSKDWFAMFNDVPRFEAQIKEGKLVLSSQPITKGRKRDE